MIKRRPAIGAFAVVAALLAGCASKLDLSPNPITPPHGISVADKRSPDKKAHKRDSVFAPLALLSEDQYSPPALSHFVSALSQTDIAKPATLEVDEFRIADYFPARLGAGGQGFLGEAIFQTLIDKNTDWTFVRETGLDSKKNSVLCIFVGRINGHEVKVSSAEPYRASPLAVSIRDDADFKRAVQVTVVRTAQAAASAVQGR